jgi:uncharacterized integral membrane protein (TIGR00698 family)
LTPSRIGAVALLPGLGLALATAVAARLLHGLLPPSAAVAVGEVLLAVLLGLLAGNLIRLPPAAAPGVRFAYQSVLRAAVVLLGAQLSLGQVAAIGAKSLLMVAVLMTGVLALAYGLGRALGVPARLATLIGVGTAVCGNSAIAATAPAIGARDEEVTFAISVNTLLGTVAVFLYPAIGRLLELAPAAYGTWAGTAVNDTSQVVAAGFAYGAEAGGVATAVKLTRNALMGVVIVAVALLHAQRSRAGEGLGRRIGQSVPPFVLGFLLLALVNTLGGIEAASRLTGRDLAGDSRTVVRLLILVALAGVGLATRLGSLRRTGPRPLVLGVALAVAGSAAAAVMILLLGPAGGS